jgi:putative ATPase
MEARIEVVQGDITSQSADVIVNAANEHLAHGGGVAAAISMAGGPTINAESRAWVDEHGPIQPGTAAVTSAGKMKARYVVHVVGPVYRTGQDNAALLAQAVWAALDAAAGLGANSIALPALSAGIFGYPPVDACSVIVRTVRSWPKGGGSLESIRLVAFDAETADHFRTALGS